MGNMFQSLQIYGTSNRDLHLGLGYINYDRDADLDVSELIVVINRIDGPNSDGSYNLADGGTIYSYNFSITVKDSSEWYNTELMFTHNNGTGIGTYKGYAFKESVGVHNDGDFNIAKFNRNGEDYTTLLLHRSVRGFAKRETGKDVSLFAKSLGFQVPYYDGRQKPLDGLTNENKPVYIVEHPDLKPDNQDIIDGDYGVTFWDLYCYNKGNPSYRLVWNNPFVEENGLVNDATIRVTYTSLGQSFAWEPIEYSLEYDYKTGYCVLDWNYLINQAMLHDDMNIGTYYMFILKFQLLNSEGISVLDRRVEIAPDRDVYYGAVQEYEGDVLVIHLNETGEDDKGYLDRSDELDKISDEEQFGDSNNLLITSYSTFDEQLQSLSNEVWNVDFFDQIFKVNSYPLDNLVNVYRTPFSISSGENVPIMIGNYESKVVAGEVNDSGYRHIATFKFESYYNSFLDYEPYTNIYMFIPLYGLTTISPSKVLERDVDLIYNFDVRSGQCLATLRINNNTLYQWECTLGDTFQLSSTNRSTAEIAGAVSILGSIANIAGSASSVQGVVSSSIGAFTDTVNVAASNYEQVRKGGNFNTNIQIRNGLTAYVIYDRPSYQEPMNYAHVNGKPCNLTKTISTLRGYTEVESCELRGIPCTQEERDEIMNILTTGFFA